MKLFVLCCFIAAIIQSVAGTPYTKSVGAIASFDGSLGQIQANEQKMPCITALQDIQKALKSPSRKRDYNKIGFSGLIFSVDQLANRVVDGCPSRLRVALEFVSYMIRPLVIMDPRRLQFIENVLKEMSNQPCNDCDACIRLIEDNRAQIEANHRVTFQVNENTSPALLKCNPAAYQAAALATWVWSQVAGPAPVAVSTSLSYEIGLVSVTRKDSPK